MSQGPQGRPALPGNSCPGPMARVVDQLPWATQARVLGPVGSTINQDAFYQAAWNPCIHHTAWTPLHSIGMLWSMLDNIHCIKSGFIGSRCLESTAFNHAAWNPLHSIGFNFLTLHGIHCIQTRCMEPTAFNRDPLGHAAWNPLHSIGIHLTPLHGMHCVNRDAFYHAAWNPLHSMTLHGIHCIHSGSI